MKAWVIDRINNLDETDEPLRPVDLPKPVPGEGEVLIQVSACGVCHTELDEIEGRTPPLFFPIVPGHQVVGVVAETGGGNMILQEGMRVGVAWIYSACGRCEFCRSGHENLCENFLGTGRDAHGGYAEYMVVPEKYAYPIPPVFSDTEAAPLLCAGAIGFRSLQLCNIKEHQVIGLMGFGASAHLVLKFIKGRFPQNPVFAFARNPKERSFALKLGADWAGAVNEQPPVLADAIIDTTPAWEPIVSALEFLKPGGRLVINAIRKEPADQEQLLNLNYEQHLWMEKEIKSVANITGNDVKEFLRIAGKLKLHPEIEVYPFDKANQAILDIKHRNIKGAKVLVL
ncbi:MAG TPA: zinc-dependent alcohol dehydrogenase family protein [Mariniphaga sp.]|nr:zinc-dependent alcohol dehydrogenase family protein [Mariniphaga sp.]